MLRCLESDSVDVPSEVFKQVMSGKAKRIRTELDNVFEGKLLSAVVDEDLREMCKELFKGIDNAFDIHEDKPEPETVQSKKEYSFAMDYNK